MKLGLCASAFAALLVLAPEYGLAETLIRLDLPDNHSRLAVREMKAELDRIVEDAELELSWQNASHRPRSVNGQIVSVSLQGGCFGRLSGQGSEGPLGWTKTVGGLVVPYIELSCDRVESLLEPAWADESQLQRELFLGRALGRVLAHELAHAMTRTRHHADEGLRKRALSPRELIVGKYRMTSADFERDTPASQLAAARAPVASDGYTAAAVDGGGR